MVHDCVDAMGNQAADPRVLENQAALYTSWQPQYSAVDRSRLNFVRSSASSALSAPSISSRQMSLYFIRAALHLHQLQLHPTTYDI
jgi:hypothetical protein